MLIPYIFQVNELFKIFSMWFTNEYIYDSYKTTYTVTIGLGRTVVMAYSITYL